MGFQFLGYMMPHKIRLFLVRHAVSEANLDNTVNARLPDSKISLAPIGFDQAKHAGRALATALTGHRVRILCSPYTRTRQTAENLLIGMGDANQYNLDYREELALREISFGLFDGIPDNELADRFPLEYAHYKKYVDFEGEFYAPMPMGESRAQVADRVKSVFGTILRDSRREIDPIENFIIVSHGCTLRAFIMQWMHEPPEWYQAEPNPYNASISVIESDGTYAYRHYKFFDGFKNIKNAQEVREEDGVKKPQF
jgi:2,3-bisphosphoglycerate-dependent phosphoglycerate mutase